MTTTNNIKIGEAAYPCTVRHLRTGDILSFFRLLATIGGSVDQVSEMFSSFTEETDKSVEGETEDRNTRRGLQIIWVLFNNLMTRGYEDFVSWLAGLVEIRDVTGKVRCLTAKELLESDPETLLFVLEYVSSGDDLKRFFSGLWALFSKEPTLKERTPTQVH